MLLAVSKMLVGCALPHSSFPSAVFTLAVLDTTAF